MGLSSGASLGQTVEKTSKSAPLGFSEKLVALWTGFVYGAIITYIE